MAVVSFLGFSVAIFFLFFRRFPSFSKLTPLRTFFIRPRVNPISAPELEGDDKAAASGEPVKIDEGDVKLVMEQANCDEAKATKALTDAKGDLIAASE